MKRRGIAVRFPDTFDGKRGIISSPIHIPEPLRLTEPDNTLALARKLLGHEIDRRRTLPNRILVAYDYLREGRRLAAEIEDMLASVTRIASGPDAKCRLSLIPIDSMKWKSLAPDICIYTGFIEGFDRKEEFRLLQFLHRCDYSQWK